MNEDNDKKKTWGEMLTQIVFYHVSLRSFNDIFCTYALNNILCTYVINDISVKGFSTPSKKRGTF